MNSRISFEKILFWALTSLFLVCFAGMGYMMFQYMNEITSDDLVWYVVVCILMVLLPSMYIILAIVIYKDASRKKMNVWLWMTAVMYIPNLVGLLLYFIVRKQHQKMCTNCNRSVGRDFEYCPYCGQIINPSGVRI